MRRRRRSGRWRRRRRRGRHHREDRAVRAMRGIVRGGGGGKKGGTTIGNNTRGVFASDDREGEWGGGGRHLPGVARSDWFAPRPYYKRLQSALVNVSPNHQESRISRSVNVLSNFSYCNVYPLLDFILSNYINVPLDPCVTVQSY